MNLTRLDEEKRSFITKAILYAGVMVFFLGVVFLYFCRLYSETKEDIIKSGQINAVEAANQIDKKLAENMSALMLTSHTVDEMLAEQRPKDEIIGYLTDESKAVIASLISDTTGMYGYIDGEYMDGSGWVPEEGYVPVDRPWYTEARAGKGDPVIVDPYVDMYTGNVMISLAKLLKDGESVLAIDVAIDDIQTILESRVADSHSYSEFLVNSQGDIIANSNRELIGRNVREGSDPLTLAIADRLGNNEDSYCYLGYEGRDYMLYFMPLENSWNCVSVIDASSDFDRLNRSILITTFVSALIVAIFVIILVISEKKDRRARELAIKSERATAANEAKSAFMSRMSHELRTPVNAILGMNEMISRESDDDSVVAYSDNIKAAGDILLGMIDDVLDHAKYGEDVMESAEDEGTLDLTAAEGAHTVSMEIPTDRSRREDKPDRSSGSIVYTNDNCIGCNKCIKVCSAIGACISREEKGRDRIDVDGSKCVACGSCLDVCVHNAREYRDDTDRFFEDLKNGEEISLLLAPAFKANYPDEYESVLGGLKALGVKRIISVSFGADISTWGYLNYIKEHNFIGGISQPCPALVSYIERYLPELLPKLFPVQSPLMCAAIYARKKMGITDKFAFISPCIAKKLEIEDPHNEGLVQYNVTFEHLMRYVREHDIKGPAVHSEIEYGLGSFYPTPGGLAENMKWFLGDDVFIRQIEGERHLYDWLHANEDRIREQKTPFLFIDALNCEKGCICGTAVNPEKSRTDDALYALLDIRENSKKDKAGDAWSRSDSPEERLQSFNEQFRDLDLNDYTRGYTDRSAECTYEIPDDSVLDAIFNSMNKPDEESRHIDCTCCGYDSCRQMAVAIYNGFNHKENCIYYEKTMVQVLEIEKEIAEEATKAKSSFLANMSHEIRTPINAVLGFNEMILRESKDPDITNYSENIKSAGDTLLGLVNNILDFSKIEAGKMDIETVDYDLYTVINDLVNMIRFRAVEKGLDLNLEVDPNTPKTLHGDEIRIKQIITNLLTNAVKYTESGSVTFIVGYEDIPAEADHINLKVRVVDTGIGIKEEDIGRLFEQFDRIEEKRNRNIEGTGLGMNITLRLLEMMNSTLDVKSEYGKGSEFGFVLKQKVVKRTGIGELGSIYMAPEESYSTDDGVFTAPDARVLVIDDNAMNLMVFKSLLKRTEISVDTAEDGDGGLKLAAENKYDVIFFDHMMPGKDGIETLHELRSMTDAKSADSPAICLTANAISGARELYMEAGFDDYLTKPVDPEILETMLARHLPDEKVIYAERPDADGEQTDEEISESLKGLDAYEGIDVTTGINNSGSAASYMSMLKIFHNSISDKTGELQGLYDEEGWSDYTIKVHALKSSAKIIGAMKLAETAQELENAGKAGDIEFIKKHHDGFMRDCLECKKILEEYVKDEESPIELRYAPKVIADSEMMKFIYDELRKAADDMDIEAIEEILDGMKGYTIVEEETEKYNKIIKLADIFDYDGIMEVIDQD